MKLKTMRQFVMGICASTLTLTAFANPEPVGLLDGNWKSACFSEGQVDGKDGSSLSLLECSNDECKITSNFYWGNDCEGNVVSSQNDLMKYEVEGSVGTDLYDLKTFGGPNQDVCYTRMLLDADKLYFAAPLLNDEEPDCSTPEKRFTEINPMYFFTKQ